LNYPFNFIISPNRVFIAIAQKDGTFVVYDVRTSRKIWQAIRDGENIPGAILHLTPNGKLVIAKDYTIL
jgi:hypothetical protein